MKPLTLAATVALLCLAPLSKGFAAEPEGPLPQQKTSPVPPGDPKTTVPEKLAPDTQKRPDVPETGSVPSSPPGSLSDKLGRSDGVIRPPQTTSPEIIVPAPVPEPNTTPVLPPPGSLGNPSPVRPK